MKKITLTLLFTASSFLLFSQGAPDWGLKKGSFGVGIWPSLGSSSTDTDSFGQDFSSKNRSIGITGRYSVSKVIQFEANLGLTTSKSEFTNQAGLVTSNIERSGINYGVTALATKTLIQTDKRALTLSPSIGIIFFNGTDTYLPQNGSTIKDDVVRFQFAAGLRPEYHFSNFLGMHGSVGFVFSIISLNNETETRGGVVRESTKTVTTDFTGGDLLGAFGFTVWFN